VRSQLVVAAALVVVALCAGTDGRAAAVGGGPLQVVAAENFWGSIAAQLGGDRVHVTSVITSPATDPHDYEPTAIDARALAGAGFVIVNGVGYDPWAAKLLAANPVHARKVLTVGDLVGVKAGGNPHRWYSPPNVQRVIAAISKQYATLDPRNARYFAARKARFERVRLARYKRLLATIRMRYARVPVGASESVFAPLATGLGVRLATPPSFLKAISEGTDPTAKDKATVDRQIARHLIKVWVYNSQNATPDIARLTDAARKKGIPVVTITETLTPASARFQDWQAGQLARLAAALRKATGR
jgi:zinc/manganese transport system substrate-binding protein